MRLTVRCLGVCNRHPQVGELLKDWRRINVAFTRAKKKLLVIGSALTLRASEICAGFLDLMAKNGWHYQIPRGSCQQ